MNKIEKFLQKSGWSKARLAKELKLTVSQIYKLITDKPWGNKITPRVAQQIEDLKKKVDL